MAACSEDPFATHPPTDYKYEGDMKKRSDIMKNILTTDVYVQQLNKEHRESLDVPDATDITISKRKWEKAVNRFRTHIRDVYMRQFAEDLELWELNSNVEDVKQGACEKSGQVWLHQLD